jgi:hypothetical protein
MGEFDTGISFEESGLGELYGEVAPASDGEVTEVEAIPEVVEAEPAEVTEDNPWSWVDERGVTPEVVRDSFEHFTQKTQEISAKEKELSEKYDSYIEFANELQADPALQQVIRDYYAQGETPDRKIATLSSELDSMKTQMAIGEELKTLESYVSEKNLPEFDADELLDYAVEHQLPDLMTTYKAMTYEVAMKNAEESARASLESDMKKSKGAALPKSGRADTNTTTKTSAADIAKMSEEEFLENYNGILKGAAGVS